MKTIFLFTFLNFMHIALLMAQTEVYVSNGNIFVKNPPAEVQQITKDGKNELLVTSADKSFFVYRKLVKKSLADAQEEMPSSNQYNYYLHYIKQNKATLIFTDCHDGKPGTVVTDTKNGNTQKYEICNPEKFMLSTDKQKLFFQASQSFITSSPDIYCYNISTNKLQYFAYGWLKKVIKEGVIIEISDIDSYEKNGQTFSNGRYIQECLYDFNGKFIKTTGPKKF